MLHFFEYAITDLGLIYLSSRAVLLSLFRSFEHWAYSKANIRLRMCVSNTLLVSKYTYVAP